jgi:NAD(P)-dependent dehydrogenase (short-subunit alcohol dehydrogenase family)
VAPGLIWSPLNTHGSPEEKLKKFGEDTAFSRPGQPIELAPVYVLLASDEASNITGEIYGVTGGGGLLKKKTNLKASSTKENTTYSVVFSF